MSALAPQLDPANLDRTLFLVFTLAPVFCRCCLCDKVRSNSKVTPRYTGKVLCLSSCPSIETDRSGSTSVVKVKDTSNGLRCAWL